MKKKTKISALLLGASVLALGGITAVGLNSTEKLSAGAECSHNGYHYDAKAATNQSSGWQEFWSCCQCHEAWLEKPLTGVFTNQDSSKMSGGVGPDHIAYIAPLTTKVSIYNDVVKTYVEAKTRQEEFDVLNYNSIMYHGCSTAHDYQNHVISWASDGSASYNVVVAKDSAFSEVLADETVTTTSYNYGLYVPGKTYYVRVTGQSELLNRSFTINDNEIRYVNVDGALNMRDLGGWETTDGEHVNYELLYRGCNLNGNPFGNSGSGNLTEKGKQTFKEDLGIKTEIDLRTPCTNGPEHLLDPSIKLNGDDGGQHAVGAWWDPSNGSFLQADTHGQCYDGMLYWPNDIARFKELMPQIFDVVANANNYPIYFHCNAGADRTGTFGFIFNGLLGVPYEQLVKDFEMTSFSKGAGMRWRNKTYTDDTPFKDIRGYTYDQIKEEKLTNSFDAMYVLMMEKYANGGTLADAIESWLLDMNVTQQQIDAFKDIMLSDVDYSKYEDQTFTVTVKNLGGEDQNINVQGGKVAELPVNPKKDAHVFDNWYDLDGNVFSPYTRIIKDTTVVAGWNKMTDNVEDKKLNIVTWNTDLGKEAASLGTNNMSYFNSISDGLEFGTRKAEEYEYAIALPAVKYSDYKVVDFRLNSGWISSQFSFGTSKDSLTKFGSASINKNIAIRILGTGEIYADGAKVDFELTEGMKNGSERLFLGNHLAHGQAHATSDFQVGNFVTYQNTDFPKIMECFAYINGIDYDFIDIEEATNTLAYLDAKYDSTLSPEEKLIYPIDSEKVLALRDYLAKLPKCTVTFKINDKVSTTQQVKVGGYATPLGLSYKNFFIDGYELNGSEFDFTTKIMSDTTIDVVTHLYDNMGSPFKAEVLSEVTDIDIPLGFTSVYKITEKGFNKPHNPIIQDFDFNGYKTVEYYIMGDANNDTKTSYMMNYQDGKMCGSANNVNVWNKVSVTKLDNGQFEVYAFTKLRSEKLVDLSSFQLQLNTGTYYVTNVAIVA